MLMIQRAVAAILIKVAVRQLILNAKHGYLLMIGVDAV